MLLNCDCRDRQTTVCTTLVTNMDIEGAEIDALIGACNTIQNYHPILAICVYHKPDHLWKIPLLISTYFEDYQLFLRPHDEEGWDLVCYAIPPERLLIANTRKR